MTRRDGELRGYFVCTFGGVGLDLLVGGGSGGARKRGSGGERGSEELRGRRRKFGGR